MIVLPDDAEVRLAPPSSPRIGPPCRPVEPGSTRLLGVGIDLCETDRMLALLDRMGERFLLRAYTPAEALYITGRGDAKGLDAARRCAGLFAGKEAVVKCLGTGFSCGVGWKSVELVPPCAPGIPWGLALHGEASRRNQEHLDCCWTVDIQQGRDHAMAVAIWRGRRTSEDV